MGGEGGYLITSAGRWEIRSRGKTKRLPTLTRIGKNEGGKYVGGGGEKKRPLDIPQKKSASRTIAGAVWTFRVGFLRGEGERDSYTGGDLHAEGENT